MPTEAPRWTTAQRFRRQQPIRRRSMRASQDLHRQSSGPQSLDTAPLHPCVRSNPRRRAPVTGLASGARARWNRNCAPSHSPGESVSVLVVGTLDTKGEELRFIARPHQGGGPAGERWSICRPRGRHSGAGRAAAARSRCTTRADRPGCSPAIAAPRSPPWRRRSRHGSVRPRRRRLAGIISAGGSGGTALGDAGDAGAAGRRAEAHGLDRRVRRRRPYVGPSDIMMMYSVTDVQGLNRDLTTGAGNGAHAMAGMVRARLRGEHGSAAGRRAGEAAAGRPDHVRRHHALRAAGHAAARSDDYDCLVFHATGIGGQSMEKLVDARPGAGGDRRHDHRSLPTCWWAACSRRPRTASAPSSARGCPMSVRSARSTWSISARPTRVPERYRGRALYQHNPQVTLMRTTAGRECRDGPLDRRAAQPDGRRRCASCCRRAGVSALDAPGKPFHDPAADAALFAALEATRAADGVAPAHPRCRITSTTRRSPPRWSQHFRALHGARPRARAAGRR